MGYGYKAGETAFVGYGTSRFFIPSLLGITRLGVTGFIFISGFYGIRLKISRIVSLWTATCFYSVVSAFGLFFMGVIGSGRFFHYLLDAPISLFDGWWFIQSYLIIMLLSPIIELGIKQINKVDFLIIVSVLFVIQYFVQWYHVADSGPSLMKFIITYMIGRYCGSNPIPIIKNNANALLVFSSFLLVFVPFFVCLIKHEYYLKWINTNFNPVCLLVVYCLILVAVKTPRYAESTFLTTNVLAVYLLHSSKFGNYLLWDSGLLNYRQFNVIYAILLTICIYILCAIIEEIRKFFIVPIDNLIIKKIKLHKIVFYDFIKKRII